MRILRGLVTLGYFIQIYQFLSTVPVILVTQKDLRSFCSLFSVLNLNSLNCTRIFYNLNTLIIRNCNQKSKKMWSGRF